MHALAATLLSLFLLAPIGPGWLGVFLDAEAERAVVTDVIDGSPAQQAGFAAGDVMLAVDGKETATREAFVEAIRGHESGSRVRVKVRRGEADKVLTVRLGERPAEGVVVEEVVEAPQRAPIAVAPERAVQSAPSATGKGYLGISVLETDKGVVVDRVLPDSPAAEAGLVSGETLHSIGDHKVGSLGDLDRALQGKGPGARVAIGVSGEQGKRSVMVELGQRPGAARAPIATDIAAPPVERVIEVSPREPAHDAAPARPIRTSRPARPARPAEPARPAQPARPAEPAQPARPAQPEHGDDNAALREELRELRKELAELRRMLERLKKEGRE